MKIKLTKKAHGFSRIPFPTGTVLDARIGPHGELEVEVGGSPHRAPRYLPLGSDRWELVVDDEGLRRLLDS